MLGKSVESILWRQEINPAHHSPINAINDLILDTTEDGSSQFKLWTQGQSAWLTQLEMAELFASSKQNITQPLKSILSGSP